MRKGFLFLLLILALSRGAFSQEIAPADTFMWKGVTKDTIPIELINGSLIVKVSIAGSAYRFIFDTGATLSISENLFLRAHFKSKSHQVVQDATGHIDSMKRLMIPGIRLGKFDILNCPANVLDYEKGSFFNCQNIDGMIGGEIFRSCAVEIDLKKKRLIISSQPPNQPLAANEFPVFFDEQFSPLFNIKINNAYDLKVLFDTGAEDLLTIPGEAFDLGGRYCVFKEVRYGTYSLAGIHNVSVSDEYKIIALDNLQVGNLLLRSPEMSVVAQTDISILGLDILKYGMMHIDYRSAKMSFTPYTSDPVFEQKINFPGFSIGRENKMYVINGLEYGSEADRAGLKTGMQITKMAGLNLATYSAEKDCRILKKEFSKRKWLTVEYIDLRGRKRSVMLIRPAKEKKRPLLNSKV